MQGKTECNHPRTVEIYFGIFKCSACGELSDEANDELKEHRGQSQENAEKRQRKQEYYRKRRYKQ